MCRSQYIMKDFIRLFRDYMNGYFFKKKSHYQGLFFFFLRKILRRTLACRSLLKLNSYIYLLPYIDMLSFSFPFSNVFLIFL